MSDVRHSPDIAEVRRNTDLVAVARGLGVDLRQDGAEFVGCCPLHSEKTPSFTIFQGRTDGVWRWRCFGCDEGGDVIDLVEKVQGIGTGEAIRFLNGDRPAGPNVRREALPPPPDPYAGIEILHPPADLVAGRRVQLFNPKRAKNSAVVASAVYPYKSADGTIFGYVLRHDLPDGGKETPMVCWVRLPDGRECWARMPFPRPRMLYGLDRLGAKGQVIVVEGEKCADALWLLRGKPVVSWAGGTHGATHADWSALAGRDVVIWPDADRPGYATAANIGRLLGDIAQRVRYVDVMAKARLGDGSHVADGEPYLPGDWQGGLWPAAGFDVADAVGAGWSRDDVTKLMSASVAGDLPEWADLPFEPSPPEPDAAGEESGEDWRALNYENYQDVGAAGDDAASELLALPGASRVSAMPRVIDVEHGSEIYVAQRYAQDLKVLFGGRVVYAEGAFWVFDTTCWMRLPDRSVRIGVHRYDNATVNGKTPLKISKKGVDGIVSEAGVILSEPGFFDEPSVAANVANTTIFISDDGVIDTRPHDPNDRFRFTLPAEFTLNTEMTPPEGSMLRRLLDGAFGGDPDAADKIDLIGEILGAAAFNMATRLAQPKGFIFLGESASNGKSTIASLLQCLLPVGSVSSIPPAAYEDEKRIIGLVGRAANVADELSASAISGEVMKSAITGNPISGRGLYKDAVTFTPRAIHVFTSNNLPRFSGGLDRGLQRRLVVLRFNRTIPESEIIVDIMDRIRRDELELLLGFAVAGAQRLKRRRGYTIPQSSAEALRSWLLLDPITEWAEERLSIVELEPMGGWPRTSELFKDFREWATGQGHAEKFLPVVTTFGQKLRLIPGLQTARRAKGTVVVGGVLADGYKASRDTQW